MLNIFRKHCGPDLALVDLAGIRQLNQPQFFEYSTEIHRNPQLAARDLLLLHMAHYWKEPLLVFSPEISEPENFETDVNPCLCRQPLKTTLEVHLRLSYTNAKL